MGESRNRKLDHVRLQLWLSQPTPNKCSKLHGKGEGIKLNPDLHIELGLGRAEVEPRLHQNWVHLAIFIVTGYNAIKRVHAKTDT